MKRRKKVAIFCSLIFSLIGVVLLYTQSNNFRNNLKRGIEYYASQAIHGSLTIASLEGNIFNGIELHQLELKDSINKPVVYLHYLKADWDLKKLIHKTLLLKKIEVDSLNVYISQEKDHSLSIQNLIKQEEKQENTKELADEPLPLEFDIKIIEIRRSTAFLNFPDSTRIPKSLLLNSLISAKISSDTSTVKLQNFNLKCKNPDFEVLSFTTDVLFTSSLFKLDNLELKTNKSFLSANAEIPLNNILEGKASASFSPLALEEFQAFIDQEIQGSPEIKLNIHKKNDASNFEIDIKEQSQNITIAGRITSLDSNASYKLSLDSKQFNLGYWLANNNLQTNINGHLFAKGQNLSAKDSRFSIHSQFSGSQMDRYPLDSMSLYVSKQKDSLIVQTKVSSLLGKFKLKARVTNLFDQIKYQLSSDLQQVDIGRIIQQKDLQTNINAHINLKGVGREPQKLESQLALKITPSYINGFKIEEAELLGDISQGNYAIDTLVIKSSDIDVEADGKGNINDKHSWLYSVKLKSLNSLSSFVKLPDINGTGQLEGEISGKADSLLLHSKLHLSKFNYDTLKLKSLRAEAHLSLVNKVANGSLDLDMHEIELGKNLLVSLFKSKQTIENNVLKGVYKIQLGDSIELNTHLRASKKDSLLIQVSQFSLRAFSQHWKNEKESAQFILKPQELKFTDVNFSSKDQYIRLNGIYSFKGKEDLSLELSNIQLAQIPELNKLIHYPISGEINGNLILKGSASEPVITSQLSLSKGHLGSFSLDSLFFKFDYKNEQVKHQGILIKNNTTLLKTEAFLPVHLSLTDSIYLITAENENYLRLKTTNLDLSQFNDLINDEGQTINGKLNTEIEAKIEANDIDIKGQINLTHGVFKMPKYGINYDKVNLALAFNKDQMVLDSLYIASGKKGYLSLKGEAKLPKNLSAAIQDIDLHLEADHFTALKSYDAQIIFNADSRLTGSLLNPIVSGGLTLVKSKINIDPFMENTSVKALDTPLLIAALEEEKNRISEKDTSQIKVDSLERIHHDIFKNLRGEFRIDIPKNTWIKSSYMQVELSGLIKMIKTKDEPEFFGNISVVRGFVEFSGRKFKISKGDINLRGGSEIDPSIDIVMNYKFRDVNKDSKSLELKLSGTLKDPSYAFSLDNEYIEENDAISYLLFGKKMDELATSEQGQISGNNNHAKSLVYSQVSNLFQKLISKGLGLDSIEISGEDNWESGAITFGKYITNDLYMSYSQLFSTDSENKELVPYRLILEYHIIRSLLLQASNEGNKSGFDLLWKIKL